MNKINPFVIIATYNETENIKKLVPMLLSLEGINVLIIDDNSPDGTADIVNEFSAQSNSVYLIKREGKLGYGTAVMAGIKKAMELNASHIITMDADFSHDPAEIPNFIEALKDSDMVIGSRYINGVRILNWELSRLFLSVFANKYVNFILGFDVTDCTSGFRGYRAEIFNKIDLSKITSNGYSFIVELLFKINKAGFTINELPIIYSERRLGQSKMSKKVIWESFFKPWALKFFG